MASTSRKRRNIQDQDKSPPRRGRTTKEPTGEGDEPVARRSTRSNKGQGGAAGEAVQHRKKPRKTTFDASANTGNEMSANPMAPEAPPKRRRRSKTTTAPASNNAAESQVASASHPQPPMYLVPPGTEPVLPQTYSFLIPQVPPQYTSQHPLQMDVQQGFGLNSPSRTTSISTSGTTSIDPQLATPSSLQGGSTRNSMSAPGIQSQNPAQSMAPSNTPNTSRPQPQRHRDNPTPAPPCPAPTVQVPATRGHNTQAGHWRQRGAENSRNRDSSESDNDDAGEEPSDMDGNSLHAERSQSDSESNGEINDGPEVQPRNEHSEQHQLQDWEISPDEDNANAMQLIRSNPHLRTSSPPLPPRPQAIQQPGAPPTQTDGAPSNHNNSAGYQFSTMIPQGVMISESSPVNIVVDHRRRNRAPKPPNPLLLQDRRSLSSIGDASSSLASSSQTSPILSWINSPSFRNSDNDSSSDHGVFSGNDNGKQCAKRNSRIQPNQSNAVPSQLRYYNSAPRWKSLLEKAKCLYRVFLACENAFPTKDEALKEAKECISELLANEDVEDDFEINQDMLGVLTGDASTFRGELKKFIRPLVPTVFHLKPTEEEKTQTRLSQDQCTEFTVNRVRNLLSGNVFVHGERDEEGTQFGNPFFKEIMQEFYYTGKRGNSLARLCPECFSDEVPAPCIALSACIQNCLEEWITGTRKDKKFEGGTYEIDYRGYLRDINAVLAQEIFGAKYTARVEAWAYVDKRNTSKRLYAYPTGRVALDFSIPAAVARRT